MHLSTTFDTLNCKQCLAKLKAYGFSECPIAYISNS